jgi:hypothetical protein
MTQTQTTSDKASLAALRSEAQELHRNIVALGNDSKASSKLELEKLQTHAKKFGEMLKLRAGSEKDAIKATMHEAGTKLVAVRSKIEDGAHESVEAVKEKFEQAKVRLLDSMTAATRSLSDAVAAQRKAAFETSAKKASA